MNMFNRYLSDEMLMVNWRYNCKITQVWATNTLAWIYIESPAPAGWRQLAESSINMFDLAKFAKIFGRLVNVYEDSGSKILVISMA
jgi:hypothetical protein